MIKIKTSSLLKQKILIGFRSAKHFQLKMGSKRLPGRIFRIYMDVESTKFEVSDYIKVSKKLRSNTKDLLANKEIFQYAYIGICIATRHDYYSTNTTILIRNCTHGVPFEMSFPVASPLITAIIELTDLNKFIYFRKAKLYYLRNKPNPQSTLEFDYIADMLQATTEVSGVKKSKL